MAEQRKYDLEMRLIRFAVSIIHFTEQMKRSPAGVYYSGQLLRSGSAPALMYGEAQSAESPKDFIHKVKMLLKELRESHNSLRIIALTELHADKESAYSLIAECNELISIFVISVKTATKNMTRNNPPQS